MCRGPMSKLNLLLLSCFISTCLFARTQHLPPPPAPLASILKFPPERSQKEIAYHDLVCTEQDRANIWEIVTTVGKTSKLGLVPKTGHLKRLGAQINHVHPLKFLGTIFSQSDLKVCMKDIFDDYFKRSSFMDDLAPALSREANKGKLMAHLEPFSKEIGQHPHNTHHIRAYFQSQEWENFVRFLIKN